MATGPLKWDQTGERFYETGIDRGVLFVMNGGAYGAGVAWNGLTSVTESRSGAEETALYADNIKYLALRSNEEFGGTIEAYSSPEEFDECDGTASLTKGVGVGQQARKAFGFAYRTKIGNDTDGTEKGYKLHLVYNATANPSERQYQTINDSPEAMSLSWEFTTIPIEMPNNLKPAAHIEIDSTKVDGTKLAAFEKILYGSDNAASKLPTPEEVFNAFKGA